MVTKDIVPTLENRYKKIIRNETKTKIRKLEEEFLNEFWQYVPENVAKESLDAEELSRQLAERIAGERNPVITLDDVYVKPGKTAGYLSVCRIIDSNGNIIGLGARPGDESLNEQLKDLSEKFEKVALVDVGSFCGDTMVEVIKLLRDAGVEISRVYLGVWGKDAINKINGSAPASAEKTYKFYEWIELRDLLGVDGRKTEDGQIIPYWNEPVKWASIPEENKEGVKDLCLNYNKKLLEILDEQLYIFDMDGTLYGFNPGLLEEVYRNSISFLKEKLGVSEQEAEQTRAKIDKKYSGEISIGVEKEFGISREEYFNKVWDIQPEQYVKYDENLKNFLKRIAGRRVVLTSAPKIWTERVLKLLGLEDTFEDVFTGEPDDRKPNLSAFKGVLAKFNCESNQATVIGDSYREDIEPAQKLGIRTIQIGKDVKNIYGIEKIVRDDAK